jgi:hypothetical protein
MMKKKIALEPMSEPDTMPDFVDLTPAGEKLKAAMDSLTAAEQGPAWSLLYALYDELPVPEKDVWKIAALLMRKPVAAPPAEPAQGEKLAFETHEYRGYKIKAFYLNDGGQDARIEIWTITSMVRAFPYPAYKIWNISAHMQDVIEGYIEETAEPTVAPSQPKPTEKEIL